MRKGAAVKRVDLDELEKANSHIERWEAAGEVALWDVKGPVADVLSGLIAELRAARKVVEEAKRLGWPPNTIRLDDAVEDYDALFEEK